MAFGLSAGAAALIGAVAAPVIGGIVGSNSAGKAADAQAAAARASDATQRYFYDTTRADNQPFRDTGLAANNRLAQMLGLGGGGSMPGGGNMSRDQLRAQLINGFSTPGTPASQGVYGEIGNNGDRSPMMGYIGGTEGTPGSIDEAGLSAAIERQYTDQQATQATQAADPSYGSLMRNYGASDLASDPVLNASQGYIQPMRDFSRDDLQNDVVYQNGLQFGLDEGAKGINRQAAAGGSTLSGATLKALTRFGNDYGTTKTAGAYDRFTNNQNTKYGQRVDSFNRFNNNQDRTYNKLAGLSGAGQQATNQVSAAGQNAGNQISASQQGLGNAQGAAQIAQGNAWQGAINGGVAALRGSGYGNALAPLFDGGYGGGTGSAYGGTTDNGMFTPNRRGM